MAKLVEIQGVAGVKDFWTLLDFLNNKEEYEARVEKMEQLRDQLNEKVEALQIGNDIAEARAMAGKDRAAAAAELRDAKAKARQEAEKIKAREKALQEAVEAQEESLREFERERKAFEAEMSKLRADLDARAQKAAALDEKARSEMNKAKELRQEYNAKLNNMREFAKAV